MDLKNNFVKAIIIWTKPVVKICFHFISKLFTYAIFDECVNVNRALSANSRSKVKKNVNSNGDQ